MGTTTLAGDVPVWAGPDTCPFCGAPLADGGPGFIDHLDDAPPCRAGIDRWRDRLADDLRGEWSG